MPVSLRKVVTRRILLRTPTGQISRWVTKPVFAWLGTVSVFLIWHDPQLVAWTLAHNWAYDLTLGLFLGFYLLFWWHPVGTGPRIHTALPGWMAFLYIVLGGELPNMVAGVIHWRFARRRLTCPTPRALSQALRRCKIRW
ncbi:MAG: cytochrome c oxidase assembly protein [Caldilineaceae bacterium]